MKEISSHINNSSSHDIAHRVHYWISFPAGVLLACFLNAFHRGCPPGELILQLYAFLFGAQSSLLTLSVLALPLLVVNVAAWLLYRRSSTASESTFFVVLGAILNAVVIFASTNILITLLVWQGSKS